MNRQAHPWLILTIFVLCSTLLFGTSTINLDEDHTFQVEGLGEVQLDFYESNTIECTLSFSNSSLENLEKVQNLLDKGILKSELNATEKLLQVGTKPQPEGSVQIDSKDALINAIQNKLKLHFEQLSK